MCWLRIVIVETRNHTVPLQYVPVQAGVIPPYPFALYRAASDSCSVRLLIDTDQYGSSQVPYSSCLR